MTLTDVQMRAMLADLIAAGAQFDPVATFVGVFASIVDNGGATAMADVTQATGAVATRVAVTTWGDPTLLSDGRWAVEGPVCEFRPASSAEAQVVEGWMYATLAVAGVLMAFEEFDNPVNLPDEFKAVQIVPRLCVSPDGQWDATAIIQDVLV